MTKSREFGFGSEKAAARASDDAKDRLRRLWTRQLYREYDNILYRCRVQLRPPVIQVADLASHHGTWTPLTRTIALSSNLIQNHSWDIVLEILKHEMAHQLVTETFSGGSGHGRDFAEACRRLGVAPWAATASGELPKEVPVWRERALDEEEERLLRRVEKLLALAGSSNEHEAALAMQRVQEIYRKYNLEQVAEGRSQSIVYSILHRKRQRLSRPEAMIFSILADHYFVKVIYGKIFDAETGVEYAMAELLGTRENVLMAEYVHGFLWNQIHSLWAEYSRRAGASGRRKNSYLVGVLTGFGEKLDRSRAETKRRETSEGTLAGTTALVKVADQRLEEFVQKRHPRLWQRSGTSTTHDRSLFHAGKSDGEKITLRKPISHAEGNRGLLLKK